MVLSGQVVATPLKIKFVHGFVRPPRRKNVFFNVLFCPQRRTIMFFWSFLSAHLVIESLFLTVLSAHLVARTCLFVFVGRFLSVLGVFFRCFVDSL